VTAVPGCLAALGAFQGCNGSSFQLLSGATSGEGLMAGLLILGILALTGMFVRIAQR